jgi:hypothetical protein
MSLNTAPLFDTSCVTFSRAWAMPSADTFSIGPIAALLERWINPAAMRVIDPFARNSAWANVTNDLNPETTASEHMDAVDFLRASLERYGAGHFDAALLDPPYSPRQMSEAYRGVGMVVGMKDTQNARLYSECKDAMATLLRHGGVAITCGWNSNGFGRGSGFSLREVLLVACGGAHNDYIVTVEVKQCPAQKSA